MSAFLRECKRQGCTVILMAPESLQHTAHWPMASIDEISYMPDQERKWDRLQTIHSISYLARTRDIERLVPMEDFDLEIARRRGTFATSCPCG